MYNTDTEQIMPDDEARIVQEQPQILTAAGMAIRFFRRQKRFSGLQQMGADKVE